MKKSSIVIVALVALVSGLVLSRYLEGNKPIELEVGTWFGNQSRALAMARDMTRIVEYN